MTSSAEPSLPILEFWRDLEIFNIPTAPSAKDASEQIKVETLRPGDRLPWHKPDFQPTQEHGFVHVIYVGCADMEDMSRLLLQALLPQKDLEEEERQRATGRGWLAAFVANEHGRPKLDSYLPASFAHGVDALWHSEPLEGINARLARSREEFAERRHEMASPATENANNDNGGNALPGAPLTWDHLDQEFRQAQALLGPGADATCLDWRVVVRVSRIKRRYLEESLEAAVDYLNSFYLDDINRLIAQARRGQAFGKALRTYLGAPLPLEQRIDILQRHDAMGELVSAARLPPARWPAKSKEPLVLAQQAAVAHVLHNLGKDGGTLGVNGPPGTGKTTLLCDVIADVVTQRARRIAALARPVDLFGDKVQIAGKPFYPLSARVMVGSSIVVASNNNNAVKNITQELPARHKVAAEYGEVSYFDDVIRSVFAAQKVVDDDKQPIAGWGLVAAALGNAGNRRSFARGLFRDEFLKRPDAPGTAASAAEDDTDATEEVDAQPQASSQVLPTTMKQLLEAATQEYHRYQTEWSAAKKRFLALLEDVDARKAVLLQAEKAALHVDDCSGRLDAQRASAKDLAEQIAHTERDLADQRAAMTVQQALVTSRQTTLMQIQVLPNFWDRICAFFGVESARLAAGRQALQGPAQAFSEATEALTALAQSIGLAKARQEQRTRELQDQERTTQATERELHGHQRALQAGYETGAKHFPDARLWSRDTAERHRASVAVSPELDRLRAEIFLQALELHRLTVLATAGKFISNLRVVHGMLHGKLRPLIASDEFPVVWDSFFFIVPVVSTTLASFDRLFMGMGQDSLGWLLLDEAGQATPQSAAGAIWRSRRAVLVGDPLQVEPVFTVPFGIVEEFRHRHQVAALWSPAGESVQTLADRVTRFGSWVAHGDTGEATGLDGEALWTGMPLRTHRRCDDPMFSVANQIAYAGQMVHGRVDNEGQPIPASFLCPLGESAWLDVPSNSRQHPVIEEELDTLVNCLRQLQRTPASRPPDEPGGQSKPAKIYVISPFRKVKAACKSRISKARLGDIECGTVHTFQGKEADIVFLVLGTAPGNAGARARAWASGKPNLLNVAITRAKCRLYVIGDVEQWGELSHFSHLRDALPVLRQGESASRMA